MSFPLAIRSDIILAGLLGVILAGAGTPSASRAQENSDPAGIPEVYARVEQLRADLEHIRFVMGKARNEQPEIPVTDAEPREVLFQGITMFQKSNRLSFELTRELAPPLSITIEDDVRSKDLLLVVSAALARVQHIKSALKIETVSPRPEIDPSMTPTELFRSIVQANRQLNLLLKEGFGPADVFQHLTRAIGYAARLRAQFPGNRIPEAPDLIVGQEPRDVYRRLIDCYLLIHRIADTSGLEILELQTDKIRYDHAAPADVYDIASLLVAELAYIDSQIAGPTPPRKVYYPGRKFPSDVYQRAGILEQQLLELREFVNRDPSWLDSPQWDGG